jgi:SecD/SecF fusion protein
MEIVKNLANNSPDRDFNAALQQAQKELGVKNNDSYITLFERNYKRIAPNGRLAPLFQSIENKSEITYNSTNEEVMRYVEAGLKKLSAMLRKLSAAGSTVLV